MDHRDKFSHDINLLTSKLLLLPSGLNLASRQYLCKKSNIFSKERIKCSWGAGGRRTYGGELERREGKTERKRS